MSMPAQNVRTVLFITSSRIGDAVLSSGLLRHVYETYPNVCVTICCGPLAVSLFEGFPALERIIPVKKQRYNKHWLDLWRQVALQRFDIVIDLRNSLVSRLIWANRRYVYGAGVDKMQHKVIQNAAVMGLTPAPSPSLWFSDAQKEKAAELVSAGDEPVLGIGPSANWIGKTWPTERFIDVVAWMRAPGGVMPHARVAVFAAPGEEDQARPVLESVPADKRLDLIAKTDPGTAAACLSLCDFYIGNDSGLMHCAAAAGTPTFGVFGPSRPEIYAPWGPHTAYVQTPENLDELIAYGGYDPQTCGSLMGSLSVDAVKDGITVHWASMTDNLSL